MKLAAATVPVVEGSVTPPAPPVVRVPAGASIAVPALVAETATLPKFMSTVLEIDIGVTIVADAEAVAEAWAKETLEPAMMIEAIASTLVKFFILVSFDLFVMLFVFVCVVWMMLYITNDMPKS